MTRRTDMTAGPRMPRRLARWGPQLLAVLLAAGTCVPIDTGPLPLLQAELGITPIPGFVVSVVIALAAAAAAMVRRRALWPLVVVGLASWMLMSVWAVLCAASYGVAAAKRRTLQQACYVAGASAVTVLPVTTGVAIGLPGLGWTDVLSSLGGTGLFVWLPFALGLWNRARRDVLAGLHERAEQLEREQTARADHARMQERARIARDMHDVVAHRVSLMVLHAGALEVNAKDEMTAVTAELIRTTGREALAQLRDVIGVLKDADGEAAALGPQPTLVDLDRLLGQSRAAGMSVTRQDEGIPQPLPTLLEHAAYRVIQESLTNVHKHAGAAHTEVVVRYRSSDLEVVVNNDAPQGPVEPLPGTGMGLVGLRERVELLDGEFSAGPQADGGFAVCARLPLSQRTMEEHA
ncbi:sensor histidine kinase [Streptomyces chattanoogensis]|uniref:sensor histidine kinase n=1 Tax=Streptomyces chattanoogensis TaxID=66876 RepID=UPI0036887B35